MKDKYPGLIKLPGKELAVCQVHLNLNSQVTSYPNQTMRERFSFRMFTLHGNSGKDQPEMSFDLTGEQWLELIAAMKLEYDRAQKFRKDLEAR